MSIIRRMRRQKAVYWSVEGLDMMTNALTFADPVEIDCRWDEESVEFVDGAGVKQFSDGRVYVDRAMNDGDYLRKGEIETDEVSDPNSEPRAFRIARFKETPNLRNTETLFTAYLRNKKYR